MNNDPETHAANAEKHSHPLREFFGGCAFMLVWEVFLWFGAIPLLIGLFWIFDRLNVSAAIVEIAMIVAAIGAIGGVLFLWRKQQSAAWKDK